MCNIGKKCLIKDGILAIVISILMLAIGMRFFTIVVDSKAISEAKIRACSQNLSSLYNAVSVYKYENDRYPANLDVLLKKSLLTEDFFTCPAMTSFKGAFYEYVPENNVVYNGKTPIIWDKENYHKNSGNVLFSDGSIDTLRGDEWSNFLGKVRKRR